MCCSETSLRVLEILGTDLVEGQPLRPPETPDAPNVSQLFQHQNPDAQLLWELVSYILGESPESLQSLHAFGLVLIHES